MKDPRILNICRLALYFKSVLMCTGGTDGVSQKGRKMTTT